MRTSVPRGRICLSRRGASHRLAAVNTVMSPSVVTRVLSVTVGAVLPVIVVSVMSGRWWRCDKAPHCTHCSADRGAESSTMPTGSGSADCSPTTGADQAATDRALSRIVGVSEGRGSEYQPDAEYAGDTRLLSHRLNSQCQRENKSRGMQFRFVALLPFYPLPADRSTVD